MTIEIPIFVHAYETDYAGVVSNVRYLEWFERGRYALLKAAGLKVEEILATHGVQAVVRETHVEYLGFARHEDELTLSVRVGEHSKTTSTLFFEVRKTGDAALVVRAKQTLAYINANFRATRAPEIYRQNLQSANQNAVSTR